MTVDLLFYCLPEYIADPDDPDMPSPDGAPRTCHHKSPAFRDVVVGDSIWVFTRRTEDDAYVFVEQRTVVDLPRDVGGGIHLDCQTPPSRVFMMEGQPNAEGVIRSLSITANPPQLFLSFRGNNAVKRLTEEDHRKLLEWSERLEPAWASPTPDEPSGLQNVAFKVTWVYGEHGPWTTPCTPEGRLINILREGKVWCGHPKCPCRDLVDTEKRLPIGSDPCLDYRAVPDLRFAPGWVIDDQRVYDPMPMTRTGVGKFAFLTSRRHEMAEKDRVVIACFRIDHVGDLPELGPYSVRADKGSPHALRVPLDRLDQAPRFWEFRRTGRKSNWGQGLFRYIPDEEAQAIWQAMEAVCDSMHVAVLRDLEAIRLEEEYVEGQRTTRLVSYHERNPDLRSAAVAIRVEAYFASSDAEQVKWVGRLMKIEEAAAGSNLAVDYSGLAGTGDSLTAAKSIDKLPAFIIYVDGVEKGRLSGTFEPSLEEALVSLLPQPSAAEENPPETSEDAIYADRDYFRGIPHAHLPLDCTRCHIPRRNGP